MYSGLEWESIDDVARFIVKVFTDQRDVMLSIQRVFTEAITAVEIEVI